MCLVYYLYLKILKIASIINCLTTNKNCSIYFNFEQLIMVLAYKNLAGLGYLDPIPSCQ